MFICLGIASLGSFQESTRCDTRIRHYSQEICIFETQRLWEWSVVTCIDGSRKNAVQQKKTKWQRIDVNYWPIRHASKRLQKNIKPTRKGYWNFVVTLITWHWYWYHLQCRKCLHYRARRMRSLCFTAFSAYWSATCRAQCRQVSTVYQCQHTHTLTSEASKVKSTAPEKH